MTFKSALSATGRGLLTATTVLANAPVHARMTEIDAEIQKLQDERAQLESRLIA
jgi:hypothetical protein